MIKFKELYHFEIEEAITNNKRVNCVDRKTETVQLVNTMTIQQYMSITNHDNSDNRYEFYVVEESEEEQ